MSAFASRPVIGLSLDCCAPGAYSARSRWYALRVDYAQAIQNHGGCPILLPYAEECLDAYLEGCDGILIPGGDFDLDPQLYGQVPHPSVALKPERTSFEWALVQKALEYRMPILGICGGMQLLNVARGGTLIQDIPALCPAAGEHRSLGGVPTHPIQIHQGSVLHRITGVEACLVNTSHHQVVDRLGQGLIASAHADDGLIEAIEDPDLPFCLGVQWHPEYEALEMEKKIFQAFVQAAAQYHAHMKPH